MKESRKSVDLKTSRVPNTVSHRRHDWADLEIMAGKCQADNMDRL